MEGLSPCVWGHRSQAFDQLVFSGSIPMCMGPPIVPLNEPTFTGVYPHVYGVTFEILTELASTSVLSPYVLGHHFSLSKFLSLFMSICICSNPPYSDGT